MANDKSEEAILNAATEVFSEHGFAGARVEAIAQAAGLNKAMLYYRLGDKAKLYEMVVVRQFSRLAGEFERIAGQGGSSQEKLDAILQSVARLFEVDPRLPRIMAWELASGGKTLPAALLEQIKRIVSSVTQSLAGTGLDPVLTYFSLVAPMVFITLTAPMRKSFAPGLPEHLQRISGIGVADMAQFLSKFVALASREES